MTTLPAPSSSSNHYTRVACPSDIAPPTEPSILLIDVDDTVLTAPSAHTLRSWESHVIRPRRPGVKTWLEQVHSDQSRVVFLSARTCDPDITRDQLRTHFGIRWPHVEHYTNKYQYALLLPRTLPILFFDNDPRHIDAMVEHCPWVQCFWVDESIDSR